MSGRCWIFQRETDMDANLQKVFDGVLNECPSPWHTRCQDNSEILIFWTHCRICLCSKLHLS